MIQLGGSEIRNHFPILSEEMNGKPLVYLDNAATSQKPYEVLKKLEDYYQKLNCNVHRGVYSLSQKATEEYEKVRNQVCHFIGTSNPKEIIYTRGTTEALNLVASSWGMQNVQSGDDVIVTRMEHHSNFIPWQHLAKEKQANFKIVELNSDFRIDPQSLKKALSGKPKVLAITMMSNVLGTLNPIAEITALAKEAGATVVVDAAQSVANMPVDIRQLGEIDFLAFSSHKMCGPTGVGILWGKESLLSQMPPIQFGGDMILQVKDHESKWNELPWKFEAGTPNIADVIAFGEALKFLESIGMERIQEFETKITGKALSGLQEIDGLSIVGPKTTEKRGAAISFTLDQVHPHDLGTFLDSKGIAIRAGHHCAQPLIHQLGISATTRASFYFYNTFQEVDLLVNGIREAKNYFG